MGARVCPEAMLVTLPTHPARPLLGSRVVPCPGAGRFRHVWSGGMDRAGIGSEAGVGRGLKESF